MHYSRAPVLPQEQGCPVGPILARGSLWAGPRPSSCGRQAAVATLAPAAAGVNAAHTRSAGTDASPQPGSVPPNSVVGPTPVPLTPSSWPAGHV